jgi:DNA-binding NarL/FixJ family response regulator
MKEPVAPRVISVPNALWDHAERALSLSSLVLYPVPAGAGQHQRFEVAARTMRAGVVNADLTDREVQVLVGMSHGKSNAEIGRELHLSEDTVKTHNRRMFRKLGAKDRAHAVDLGWRAGVLR